MNESLIENFKLDISNEEYKNSNLFPNQFSINFYKFNQNFTNKFIKLPKTNPEYPIKSADIYMVHGGERVPFKYELNDNDVICFKDFN